MTDMSYVVKDSYEVHKLKVDKIVFPDDYATQSNGQSLAVQQRGNNLCLGMVDKTRGAVSLAHVSWHGGFRVPANIAVDTLVNDISETVRADELELEAFIAGPSGIPGYRGRDGQLGRMDAVELLNELRIAQAAGCQDEFELDADALIVDPQPSNYATENLAVIVGRLEQLGIPVALRDIGGTIPRDVYVAAGRIEVYRLFNQGTGYLSVEGSEADLRRQALMASLAGAALRTKDEESG